MADTSQGRIGVVVPVPGPHADQLRTIRAASGDPLHVIAPHLTLVTGIPVTDWDAALAHVRSVAASTSPIAVLFEGSDTFRPVSPVVYARVTEGEEECRELHQALLTGPLDAVPEFPYVPHVTLAQNVPDDALDHAALMHSTQRWWLFVDEVAVYAAHGENSDWELLETVALGR